MKTKIIAILTPYHRCFDQYVNDHKNLDVRYIWVYNIKSAFGYTFDDMVLHTNYFLLDDEVENYVRLHLRKKNKKDWSYILLVINLLILSSLFIFIMLSLIFELVNLNTLIIISNIFSLDVFIIVVQIILRKIK